MPYRLKKVGKGYKVVTKTTGKEHSKKPLSKSKAVKQLYALHLKVKD